MFSTTIRRIMKSQKKKKGRQKEEKKTTRLRGEKTNTNINRDIRSKKGIFIKKGKVEAEKCSIGHQYKKEI